MSKSTFIATLLIAALCIPPLQSPAEAAEFRSGVTVAIGPDEVLNDDVYAVAGRIVIDGTINGDVLAAGENGLRVSVEIICNTLQTINFYTDPDLA